MMMTKRYKLLGLLPLAFASTLGQAQSINEKLLEEVIEEKTKGITIGADLSKADRSAFSEAGAEPFIAIDKTDSLNVGISYMGSGGEWKLFLSNDGGVSWEESTLNTLAILDSLYPDHTLIGGGDPVFTFGADHSIHVSWIYLHGTDLANPYNNTMECFYAVSNDFGETWSVKPYIHAGLLSSFDAIDRIWIDCDHSESDYEHNIYLTAVHFVASETGPAGQLIFRKNAADDSFESAGIGGILPPDGGQTQFGNVAVDDYGNVHMSAAIIGGATGQVAYARSTDGGNTYTTYTIDAEASLDATGPTINIHNRENAAVSLAVDGDNVYLAWTEFDTDGVQAYYVYSHDNGVSFSDRIEFSEDLNGDFYAATMPCVAADNGHMVISWYLFDRETLETKYIAGFSNDAGLSISAYETLSEPTDFSSEPTSHFYGDYNDADMSGCTAHFTWCDGSSGSPRVYHSSIIACGIGFGEASIVEHTPVTDQLTIGTIYPNPVQSQLMLSVASEKSERIRFTIHDINGKKIQEYQETIQGNTLIELNVSTLPEGTYLLKGITEDGTFFTRKWIKA